MGSFSLINEMIRVSTIGTCIHTVLQKEQPDGNWVSIDKDVISDRNYELFSFLSNVRGSVRIGHQGIAEPGLPHGFRAPKGHFMGDHDQGHINIEDLITAQYPYPPTRFEDRFIVDKLERGYTVSFLDDEELDDPGQIIRELQRGLRIIYGHSMTVDGVKYGAQLYRLVFGYDS